MLSGAVRRPVGGEDVERTAFRAMVIHRDVYPYYVHRGAEPVAGSCRGRRDDDLRSWFCIQNLRGERVSITLDLIRLVVSFPVSSR